MKDRDDYQDNPCKCQSIRDCLIVLTQTKDRNEIQLSDLNRGKNIRKGNLSSKIVSRIDVQIQIRECIQSKSMVRTI